MDKKSISQRKRESLNSLGAGKQAVEAVEKRAIDVAWVRADGAICFGNECVVIKPEPGGKNLDVEIKPSECGEETGNILLQHLIGTVGKGGNTRFTVKSDFQDERDVKTDKANGRPGETSR